MAWRRKWFWKSKAKKKKGGDEEDDPVPIKKVDKNTVSFQIVASDKFGTNTKCKAAIALLKKIPGSNLDEEAKMWVLPLDRYKSTLKVFEQHNTAGADPYIDVRPVPKPVLAMLTAAKTLKETVKELDLTRIPDPLLNALLPFQLRGVTFALRKDGRCMICDEMGLGKTIQAIAIACCYSAEWPLLIVVPSSLKHTWRKELNRWVPEHAATISVIDSTRACHFSRINIVSYDLVPRIQEQLEAAQFQVVIADESHYLKNREAQRTQAVLPLLKHAARRILLTGTPALSRPAELWPQLDALGLGIFSSFKQFGARYCAAWQGPWGMDYSGSSHLSELHTLLHECVMIRRLKANVLTELPDKQRNVVYLEADAELSAEIKRDMRTQDEWARVDEHDKRALMSQLFVQTGRAKVAAVCAYVTQLLQAEPTHKLLVFAHHMEVLDGLQRTLEEQRVSLVRIDGAVEQQQRQVLVDQFQRGHDAHHTRVALLSLTCGSFGFTLTAAQRVVFAELWWTPGQLLQAEDRAHRIGRADATQPVLIDYCLARGTMDDMIWPLIAKKLSVLGTTLNGIRGQLDIEERIDLGSAALLRVWQELGEDPIHSDDERAEPTPRKTRTARKNNTNQTGDAPKSRTKPRRAVELSSDEVQVVESKGNTLDRYLQRTHADPGPDTPARPAFVYRDPLALFRTPQPARDTQPARSALTLAPVARTAPRPRTVKSEARGTPSSASTRVVIDLDDSDEHVPAVVPKNSFKRKLEFDSEPRKKQRVERPSDSHSTADTARDQSNTRAVPLRAETGSRTVQTSTNDNTVRVTAAPDQHASGNSDEELFGLGDFDLAAQLTDTAPVTPAAKSNVPRTPVTPFRLFSSPSLSDQTKKRISLSLQKIT